MEIMEDDIDLMRWLLLILFFVYIFNVLDWSGSQSLGQQRQTKMKLNALCKVCLLCDDFPQLVLSEVLETRVHPNGLPRKFPNEPGLLPGWMPKYLEERVNSHECDNNERILERGMS